MLERRKGTVVSPSEVRDLGNNMVYCAIEVTASSYIKRDEFTWRIA
jgi:hypothetical protein